MARAGRATPASLTDGTFSITNFGVFGVDAGTPILNPPEAGILGLGTGAPATLGVRGRDRAPRHRDPQLVV
ncbi:MAG: 2-oxo acid dehydrogenase subunit E2 [Microbacterium sp.]